jgi:DNA repair protein RecO (recombination protein O)
MRRGCPTLIWWCAGDLAEAFQLTGYFLDRHVWQPRRVAPPAERVRFIARVTQQG